MKHSSPRKATSRTGCRSIAKSAIRATSLLIGIGAGQPAIAAGAGNDLWDSLFHGQAVLIGETHQRVESLDLARQVVTEARATHPCVILALEIPRDQQEILDGATKGATSVDDVFIWPAIDFPAYRVFLAEMLTASAGPGCFRVVAADLPADVPGLRDTAMSSAIREAIGDGTFVVGLFGVLHATAGIRYSNVPAERNLADQLLAGKVQVGLLGEVWLPTCEDTLVSQNSSIGRAYIRSTGKFFNGRILPGRNVDAVRVFCESKKPE